MFTIKFQAEDNEGFETTRETIDRAQLYAKSWMDCWESTEVFVTAAPGLKIFEATQFEIVKETL